MVHYFSYFHRWTQHLWGYRACLITLQACALALWLHACAWATPAEHTPVNAPKTTSASSIFGHYLVSRQASQQKDWGYALSALEKVALYDPQNKALNQYILLLQLQQGHIDKAITTAKFVDDEQCTLPALHWLRIAQALKQHGARQAEHVFSQLPCKPNVLMQHMLPLWLRLAQEPSMTIPSALTLMVQAQFHPSFTQTHAVHHQLAALHTVKGEYTRALQAWQQSNKDATTLPEEIMSLTNAQQGVAYLLLHHALFATQKTYADARIYAQLALYLHPELWQGHYMLGHMQEKDGLLEDALRSYRNIPQHSALYHDSIVQQVQLLRKLDQSKDAMALAQRALKHSPPTRDLYIVYADLLRHMAHYAQAIETYTQALKHTSHDEEDRWELFFMRGICYEQNNQWPQAEDDFLQALRIAPDQPDVLNYLAYSWVVQDMHLLQAKALLKRATQARPEDGHILDSLGWVYYRLGDFDQAVQLLETAMVRAPAEPVINDHLADAYWRTGRRQEARYQWERTLQYGPDDALRSAVQHKLRNGLPEFIQPTPAMLAEDGAPVLPPGK